MSSSLRRTLLQQVRYGHLSYDGVDNSICDDVCKADGVIPTIKLPERVAGVITWGRG
jgi:hypothetical protein